MGGHARRRVFRRCIAAGAFSILAILGASIAATQAEEAPGRNWWGRPAIAPAPGEPPSTREVLLGTITTGKAEAPGRLEVADQILADGLDALRRGDVMLARRRLEAVIDAYPESAAAATAREELGSLYNIRGRNTSMGGTSEPTARLIPAQSSPPPEAADGEMRSVGSTDHGDRGTLSKEALARERQTRRDERWLRALSFDFQMAAGDRVFFAESSIDIGARGRDVLAAQARWLTRHPDLPVFVEAHADDYTGSRDLEVQIAEQRARAVQQRLVEEGVDAARITVVAFGRDRPVATCQAPECTAQNRRVITRVGHLPDLERGRHGIEKPALAIVPPRRGSADRD